MWLTWRESITVDCHHIAIDDYYVRIMNTLIDATLDVIFSG